MNGSAHANGFHKAEDAELPVSVGANDEGAPEGVPAEPNPATHALEAAKAAWAESHEAPGAEPNGHV